MVGYLCVKCYGLVSCVVLFGLRLYCGSCCFVVCMLVVVWLVLVRCLDLIVAVWFGGLGVGCFCAPVWLNDCYVS